MSEKRFILCQDDLGNYEIRYGDKVFHFLWEVAPILNEQQSEINSLKIGLKLSSGEKLFSRRELERKVDEQQDTIRKLRNENIILKNKIEDLRVSLFMQDQVLQRQMQKSDLDE